MTANRMWWGALLGILATSACTNIPTRVHETGVSIEPVSNDTGSIRSAAFWTDRDGLSLRGEVAANPVNGTVLSGHVDILITMPDGSTTACTTASQGTASAQILKPFSQRFETLPPRGSIVRVWHHASASHQGCAG